MRFGLRAISFLKAYNLVKPGLQKLERGFGPAQYIHFPRKGRRYTYEFESCWKLAGLPCYVTSKL